MTDLHPNWQSTGDCGGAQPVRVAVTSAAAVPQVSARVSRQPAAVIGILLVTGIGVTLFLGDENSPGTLSTPLTAQAILQETTDTAIPPADIAPAPVAEPTPLDEEPTEPAPPPAVPDALTMDEEETTPPADQSDLIPLNPYTVGSGRDGNPVAPSATAAGTLHGGAPVPRPLTQPTTGPGLWIVIMGSFGLLFASTRTMLRKRSIG